MLKLKNHHIQTIYCVFARIDEVFRFVSVFCLKQKEQNLVFTPFRKSIKVLRHYVALSELAKNTKVMSFILFVDTYQRMPWHRYVVLSD